MNVFLLPDGATAHKLVRGPRNGERLDMHTLEGEIVTVRSRRGDERRYVRMAGDYLYPLDGTWNSSRAEAMNVMAGELAIESRRLIEQARELQAQAAEE